MHNDRPLPRFDFALSLAGAVSGGAYIAGVLDFLVEALDELQEARQRGDPYAPPHEAVLCGVAGASSGSLTAALLACALQHHFPHVRGETPAALTVHNPLYDSWVHMTDVVHLLDTRDAAADRGLVSLLDSSNLDAVARKAFDYGAGMPAKRRSWLAQPLRVAFTVSNLRGVPFSLACRPAWASPVQTLHADVMHFALMHFGPHRTRAPLSHERQLDFAVPIEARWPAGGEQLAAAALASAAFPGLLQPRLLRRPTSDYASMTFATSAGPGRPSRRRAMEPSWSADNPKPGPSYAFVAVDGGLMDNSPVALARAMLHAGDPSRHSPQEGMLSRRAVLMVDLLSDPRRPGPSKLAGLGLGEITGALLRALVAQLRFRPEELALAADEQVYSRFLIAPRRDGTGSPAGARDLAGGFLGGFGGYLSEQFRRHDFLLGRCNAQRYLAETFTLPERHKLFGRWSVEQRERYAVRGGELPIVPLVGMLHPQQRAEPPPRWPAGAADLDALPARLDRRLDHLYRGALHATCWRLPLYPLWRWWVRPKLRRAAMHAVVEALQAHRLG